MGDVLNLDIFPTRDFISWGSLLKTNQIDANKKVKDVFSDFLDLVAEDMVENNNIFIFPEWNFGFMKVSNMAGPNHPKYSYNIESDGAIYTVKLKLDTRIIRKSKKHYVCSLDEKWRMRMNTLIKSGHKY